MDACARCSARPAWRLRSARGARYARMMALLPADQQRLQDAVRGDRAHERLEFGAVADVIGLIRMLSTHAIQAVHVCNRAELDPPSARSPRTASCSRCWSGVTARRISP